MPPGSRRYVLDEEVYKYHSGDITIIPENFPHVTVSDGETTNFWEYIFIDLRSMIETMFPGNVAFQNDAVSSLSKRAYMTNERDNHIIAECINGIIRETNEHKTYSQRAIALKVQEIVIELLRHDASLPEEKK